MRYSCTTTNMAIGPGQGTLCPAATETRSRLRQVDYSSAEERCPRRSPSADSCGRLGEFSLRRKGGMDGSRPWDRVACPSLLIARVTRGEVPGTIVRSLASPLSPWGKISRREFEGAEKAAVQPVVVGYHHMLRLAKGRMSWTITCGWSSRQSRWRHEFADPDCLNLPWCLSQAVAHEMVVDGDDPRLNAAGESFGLSPIVRPNGPGEAEVGIVGKGHRLSISLTFMTPTTGRRSPPA